MKNRVKLITIISIVIVVFSSLIFWVNNKHQTPEVDQVEVTMEYGDTKGFLWEVKKDKARVYLFGSVHVGKSNLYPFEAVVEKAFDSSDYLVLEADITNTDNLFSTYAKMMYSGEDNAFNHMSKEARLKLEEICKEINIDISTLAKQKLWAIGSSVASSQYQKKGYSPFFGVDLYFANRAKDRSKEIHELESLDFQLGIMESFTIQEQEEYFIMGLENLEKTNNIMDDLFRSFVAGDEEMMEELLMSNSDREGNYYKRLILERNQNMTTDIEEYFKTDKTYFVVVGLAHYIGEDGIVKMLRDRGYTVNRVN